MKTKLIFDLDNVDDREAFNRMNKSSEMASIIFEFTVNSSKKLRQNTDNEDIIAGINIAFDKFFELLEEYNINIDEIL